MTAGAHNQKDCFLYGMKERVVIFRLNTNFDVSFDYFKMLGVLQSKYIRMSWGGILSHHKIIVFSSGTIIIRRLLERNGDLNIYLIIERLVLV